MPLLFQRRLRSEDRPARAQAIRELLNVALDASGLTGAAGQPLRFAPHDFRRMLITDAIMHGMPPHIAQLVAGHRDINTTMGYKAVYPEEVITGHRAFIARRRALRPSAEYRTPTDAEWEEFLGHFERRKLALGDCGRAYGTSCIHEHSCIRCPMLRIDPAQRHRLEEIRDNLTARIAEAEREGWPGEAEGLKVSLAAADAQARRGRRGPPPRGRAVTWACPPTATSPRPPHRRGRRTMTAPSLPAALRACAAGIYTHEAGVEPAHRQPHLPEPRRLHTRFITRGTTAAPQWPPSTGPQPSPRSTQAEASPAPAANRRILRLAASIAAGIPVSLSDAITGLDSRNLSHLLTAIRHASGERSHKMP